MWQDGLFCMCFDRTPVTVVKSTDAFSVLVNSSQPLNYADAMYALSYLSTMRRGRNMSLTSVQPTYDDIQYDISKMERIRSSLVPSMSIRECCRTMQDHIERLSFSLHWSFLMGNLLRPSLSPAKWINLSPPQRQDLSLKCMEAYKAALHAYVDLVALSTVARMSWAMLHNGLAAALILAITGFSRVNHDVAELQERLFKTICEAPAEDENDDQFWGPHKRGLLALKKMHESQNVEQIKPPSSVSSMRDVGASSQIRPALTAIQGGPITNPEFLSFDLQAVNDLLDFLPQEMVDNEPIIDDIFDSVIWGGYSEQVMSDAREFF